MASPTARFRLPGAAFVAAGVTFALFLLMYQLISSGLGDRGRLDPITGIHFGPVEIPDEIATKSRRKPPKPPPPKNPPPPPKMEIAKVNQQTQPMPQMDIPNLDVPMAGGGMFIGNFQQVDRTAEGDIIPVVVIRPMYPRDAAIAGIEGWVKIEFTITETGTVKDPKVLESEPARIFNREAIRAILRWKFKPRVVNGTAVERLATQVIEFNLDDGQG